jgi:hypothetical protein
MRTASSTPRRDQSGVFRKRTALAAAGLLAAALIPTIAFANLTGSKFESNDGNLVVDTTGNFDWVNAPHRQAGVEEFSGSADNSFGQGTKEDDTTPTVVTGSIPPNKSDLTRFYVANDTGSNNHKFIYLAWERTNTLGSANMDFEINQLKQPDMTTTGVKDIGATRSPGDLLIRYDFSGGGTSPSLSLVKWLTGDTDGALSSDCNSSGATLPCWGAVPGATEDGIDGVNDNQIDLSASGFADGAVNVLCSGAKKCTDVTHDPIGNIDLASATFGEAAIDLTAAGVFPAGQCRNFGSAYLKSRSSDSFTAETKDFIAPIEIDINNCGSLTIRKVTVGGSGTFGFDSTTLADQTSSDPATRFELTTTGAGSAGAADTGTAYHGILAGTYDAAENAKDGWTLTGISCVNADSSSHPATTDLTARTLSVGIAVGDDVTCTFTNTAKATIRFKKVTNPSPDTANTSFTFDPSDTLQTGTFDLKNGETKSYVDVVPGTYQAVESDPTPAYDLTGRACVLTGTSTAHTADTTAARTISVVLAAGEDVTCTFTNTKRGSLTIIKNDDAGNALDGVVFTLYTDNAPVGGAAPHGVEDTATTLTCTTASGTCSISNIPLGDYWIVETTGKTGYALAADQHLTVTAGSSATKTFVDPRLFHVITIVCQNSDGSLHPSDVTLDGTTKTSLNGSGLTQFNTDNGTSLTQAQVCSLGGASFGPKQTGTYNGNVVIN